jgi:hypothetical protein
MKARIIKQAGRNGSFYWALSVKSSDGSCHILKLDEPDYRKMNWNASDLPAFFRYSYPEDLDPPVKEFLGKVKDHINQKNELLDLVHEGWVASSRESS